MVGILFLKILFLVMEQDQIYPQEREPKDLLVLKNDIDFRGVNWWTGLIPLIYWARFDRTTVFSNDRMAENLSKVPTYQI